MSTRANIIIKEGKDFLIFYRHSDGYPEGTLPSLKKFVDLVAYGPLRDNLQQSAGWLIVIGALEYASLPKVTNADEDGSPKDWESIEIKDWKVGAYEPTTGIHGDIEHLYVIDLEKRSIDEIEIPEKNNWKSQKVIANHYQAKN